MSYFITVLLLLALAVSFGAPIGLPFLIGAIFVCASYIYTYTR